MNITLGENEKRLILFDKDSTDWTLLSNERVVFTENSSTKHIDILNIKELGLPLDIEFQSEVRDKRDFTRLAIIDHNSQKHILKIESGEPYKGF